MKPSVGRIVHYVAFGTPGGEYTAGAHRAAIITEISIQPGEVVNTPDPDQRVSLCIFNPTGLHFREWVPYSDVAAPGTWHWPEREA